jgi:hypothetical protein
VDDGQLRRALQQHAEHEGHRAQREGEVDAHLVVNGF